MIKPGMIHTDCSIWTCAAEQELKTEKETRACLLLI